ncbi:MAG: STAS-like domain-containing protein, partial [Prevotellaceae bacterium]|nr:STAS-like domain-containing protein [Prevotellaceae bacterium]
DNTAGYASSFLDEAFGNLVYDFTSEIVKNNVEIISIQEPHWKDMIENQTYKQWEERRKKSESPKVTSNHKEWYRLENNNLVSKIWEQPAV